MTGGASGKGRARLLLALSDEGGAAGPGGELRRVSVRLDGEARVDSKLLDQKAIAEMVRELEALVERGLRWGDADQGTAGLVQRLGEVLFDRVWPDAVKQALRTSPGGELRIEATGWLSALPFELMHDGTRTLGMAWSIGRARAQQGHVAEREGRVSGRALVVCDPRGDLIGAYHEGLVVRDELSRGGRWADLRSTEVRTTELLKIIRDYELLHFAGHGERPASEPGGRARGWWLGDGVLTADMIDELAGGRPLPRIVVSNACRSARRGSEEGDGRGGAGAERGLGDAMLAHGTRCFIGTTHEVPDEVAAIFAFALHDGLLRGETAGEALRQARVELARTYGETSVYGQAWVLWGDPGVTLGRPREASGALDEPIGARAVLEVGLRMRGGAAAGLMGASAGAGAGLDAGGGTLAVGPTRGQVLLAAVGALALVVLLVALLVGFAGPRDGSGSGGGGRVEVRPLDGDERIRRAAPVEHRPMSPLPGSGLRE